MRYLIGIDDTDNRESRGTGFRARTLGKELEAAGFVSLLGITRHQLLISPLIPYTAQNSAACLTVFRKEEMTALVDACRTFLLRESAPGSDAGLCIAPWEAVGPPVQAFGMRAKQRVLSVADALALAKQEGLLLEGLTGNRGGVIGAIAAVGLRAGENDGRFIWLRGTREISGVHTVGALCENTGIEEVTAQDGTALTSSTPIDVGPWVRPILCHGRATLLVEKVPENGIWRVLPKELIKQASN